MNATLPAEPRSEPLLWLQLLGLAALPLEALLLLLLLAGPDPGPWPWLERGLAWALGVLGPALLLWRRPADVFSLLLLSTPLRGRRELQRRLSGLQQGWGQRFAVVLGAAGLLPLLVWLDRWSVLARDLAPLPDAPRLVALLLSAAVLALMLWQWQQLLQAVWLLLRPAGVVAAANALTTEEIASRRLCLGLPLLLPDPLRFEPVATRKPTMSRAAELGSRAAELVPKAAAQAPKAATLNTEPKAEAEAEADASTGTGTDAAGVGPPGSRNAGGGATGVDAAAALSPQAATISDGAAPWDTQPEAAATPALAPETTLETAERGQPQATATAPALALARTLETAASGDPQATAATLALDPEETLAPVATESLELATADEAAPSPESPTPAAPLSEADSEPAPAAIPPAAAAVAAAASVVEAAEATEDQQPLDPSQDDAAPHAAADNLPEMEGGEADASAPEPPPQEIAPDLEPER